MTKVTYRIYGRAGEITSSAILENTNDFRKLLREHTTSTSAYLWDTEIDFKVFIVTDGMINTFAYNNKQGIVDLMKKPESVLEYISDFPIELGKELQEVVDAERSDS